MGIPEDRVHKAISLTGNCSLQPPPPFTDTPCASATMRQGLGKAEQSEVNNSSPELMLSERLTISGKEVNMYKVQNRGENSQSTGERFNGGTLELALKHLSKRETRECTTTTEALPWQVRGTGA